MFHEEIQAHIPSDILRCRAVSREINFTSAHQIDDFRLRQRIFFKGSCLEGSSPPLLAPFGTGGDTRAHQGGASVASLVLLRQALNYGWQWGSPGKREVAVVLTTLHPCVTAPRTRMIPHVPSWSLSTPRYGVLSEWRFNFGFVIPGSTNTWQQVIEAAENMMDPTMLSGHITIETSFFNGDVFLSASLVRVFYT
mmetsp:Transcript_27185/g.79224  ORF Transcript_27185/g.79224 Transcript_27185/m.79224 type:complete len:195 (-) Transcript_27185:227-811(-)